MVDEVSLDSTAVQISFSIDFSSAVRADAAVTSCQRICAGDVRRSIVLREPVNHCCSALLFSA